MYNLQRKKAFVTLIILFSGIALRAQEKILNFENHDLKKYYFGISLTYNSSRFQMSQHPRFLQDDTVMVSEPLNGRGLGLGLSATMPISKRFELRFNPQLIFAQKAISYHLTYPEVNKEETPVIDKSIESVITSFPLQVKFNSDRIGNFRVYMLGGVKLDYDLASNARAKQAEELVKLKKMDYGVEAGIGFNFYFPSFILSPELKISNGLGNIHSRDEKLKYSNVIDKLQSRMIMFTLQIEG